MTLFSRQSQRTGQHFQSTTLITVSANITGSVTVAEIKMHLDY